MLLDLGIQGVHSLNQHAIYELHPDARSRVITAYTTGNYLSGAAGSAAALVAFRAAGWDAGWDAAALGAGIACIGLAGWAALPGLGRQPG